MGVGDEIEERGVRIHKKENWGFEFFLKQSRELPVFFLYLIEPMVQHAPQA